MTSDEKNQQQQSGASEGAPGEEGSPLVEDPGDADASAAPDEWQAGRRSITTRPGVSRFELVRQRRQRNLRSRPFIIAAIVILAGLIAIPVYAYVQTYVIPPRQPAVRVENKTYTRGDVVDFIRFNQRLSEELGVQYEIGSSLFDALQTIQNNELAFQVAPRYGITVEPAEVDRRLEVILGFDPEDPAKDTGEFQANLAEARRQFFNRTGLDESSYREFIRKSLFKEKLRDVVAETVPRIQPQVLLFEITLGSFDAQTVQRIERDLEAGDSPGDVALRYSESPDVQRDHGDRGLIPRGVVTQLDPLLFGTNASGDRILPVGRPSEPQLDTQTGFYNIYIVAEYQEAGQVSAEHFETLTTRALNIFLNDQRQEFTVWMDLDSSIYNWVNRQVRLASILPTPTPTPFGGAGFTADDLN